MSASDRNWTIVSMIYRDPCSVDERYPAGWKHRSEKYVVDVGLKSEARRIVQDWFVRNPDQAINLNEVHYYPRNYVDLERSLRAQGRVIS